MNISYFPNLHYWLPLLENLGTVKRSCLKHCQRLFVDIIFSRKFHALDNQIQHLINLFFFMIVVAFFFIFLFLLQNTSPSLYTSEKCKLHFNNNSSKVYMLFFSVCQVSTKLFYTSDSAYLFVYQSSNAPL